MKTFDGELCNDHWHALLTDARKQGKTFHLNSGKRTMKQQWSLYRQNMSGGRPKPGRPLTAYPNPNAPHIRANHACDIGYNSSDTQEVIDYGRARGVPLARTVASEFWHIEDTSGGRGLALYYKGRTRLGFQTIKQGSKGPRVLWVQHWLKKLGYLKVTGNGIVGPKTVAALKAFQKKNGLTADGVYGYKTSVALHAAVNRWKKAHK